MIGVCGLRTGVLHRLRLNAHHMRLPQHAYQFCMRISAASLPHSALMLRSLSVDNVR